MLNSKISSSGFSQEDIYEILREEEREQIIFEEIRKYRELYEDNLYVSDFDRALYELPYEAQVGYGVAPRSRV